MRIPDEKIEEVRYAVDIIDVIGDVVTLKKTGKNFLGHCPFHQEKTPSFTVNPEMQIYKCFGCNEGGNVFSFIMKEQNISFIDALRQLAQRVGIMLPRHKEDEVETKQVEKLYAVNEFAAKFYNKNLFGSKGGKKALDYLLGRGFQEKTLIDFHVGYSPDAWEELVHEAGKASFDHDTLVESGLTIRKSPGSSPYDRFRNRIMFPISNEYGRIVGFGARSFEKNDDKNSPKYINTPETSVYHKGKLLYGLFQNKDRIRKKDMSIVVEGYTDVMALYEHGIGLGIATSGTALTPKQAMLLGRYSRNVVVLYDADTAGIKAALRGSEVLFGSNLDVQVVNLGSNADPDSYLCTHSRDDFIKAVQDGKSVIDFYATSFADSGKKLSYQEKAEQIRSMINLVDSVKDSLKRDLMLQEIGEKLSADFKTIFKEFYRKKRMKNRVTVRKKTSVETHMSPGINIDEIERELGSIMVNSSDLTFAIMDSIEENLIRSPLIMDIFKIIKSFGSGKKKYSAADIITKIQGEKLQQLITELAFAPFGIPKQDETEVYDRLAQAADEIVEKFKRRKIDVELDSLRLEIKQAQEKGSDTLELVSKYQDLLHQKEKFTHQE